MAPSEIAAIRVLGTNQSLPRTASDVWLSQSSFLDSIQLVRFDADQSEARAFARSVLGKVTVVGEFPSVGFFRRGHRWWLAVPPEGAEGGTVERPEIVYQIVLLPMAARARVWLMVFTV